MTTNRVLAGIAMLFGFLAVFGGNPYRDISEEGEVDAGAISVVQVAEWIRDRKPGLVLVDLRDSAAFSEFHVPTAVRSSPNLLDTIDIEMTVVLYSGEDDAVKGARAALMARGADGVWYMRDGAGQWLRTIMNPTIAPDASGEERLDFERVAAISRYFGGLPRVAEPVQDGGTDDVLRRTVRRGCSF